MKLVFGGVALLVIISGLFLYSQIAVDIEEKNGAEFFDLTVVKPLVTVTDNNGKSAAVEKQAKVQEGNRIKVSETGRAVLEAGNGSTAVLDRNAEIIVESYEDGGGKTTIALLAGELTARVEKILEKGEFYEVKTKNAVAAVRGTEFVIVYADGRTNLKVNEGTVLFAPLDPKTGEIIEEKVVEVGAGEEAEIVGERAENPELLDSRLRSPSPPAGGFGEAGGDDKEGDAENFRKSERAGDGNDNEEIESGQAPIDQPKEEEKKSSSSTPPAGGSGNNFEEKNEVYSGSVLFNFDQSLREASAWQGQQPQSQPRPEQQQPQLEPQFQLEFQPQSNLFQPQQFLNYEKKLTE